jgi:hypothetical protein
MERSRMMQADHGCSVCRYAGNSTDGSSISPRLSASQYAEYRRSGKDYHCVSFNRPVYSSEGKGCSSFQLDR